MAVIRGIILTTIVLIAHFAILTACGRQPGATVPAEGDSAAERAARVAGSLCQSLVIEGEPEQRWSIEERMGRFVVPAISAAVIDEGRLAWAHAWGVKEAGSDEPVTPETMFQAGSVSKPVSAMLALALVGDGVLQLDQPINEALRSWKVPDNEFTSNEPVTLRHVITHQAGFTPFAYLIPRSEPTVPSMAELLRGGVRDWPAVTVEFVPGTRHAYSNAGYCVLQLVLEDASGLSLDDLARERLFGPLGMTHSSFHEPLTPELFATVASGHTRRASGVAGRREPVPVDGGASIAPAATGGMWSTPSDLARLAVEVMRAWRGESEQLLTTELAREVMTPQAENAGLGLYLEGEGQALRARHGGAMPGFTTHMVFYPMVGKGAVVMSNSDAGRWLNQELIAAIGREYRWPGFPVRRTLGTITVDQMRELVGVYSLDASPDHTFTVRVENDSLLGQIGNHEPFELAPTTDQDLFVLARDSLEIVFQRAPDGTVEKLRLRRAGDAGNAYSRREDPSTPAKSPRSNR